MDLLEVLLEFGVISAAVGLVLSYLVAKSKPFLNAFFRETKMVNVWTKSGIRYVFDNQKATLDNMYKDAKDSTKILCFSTFGGTFSLRDSDDLHSLLNKKDEKDKDGKRKADERDIRFLIMNPESEVAQKRKDEFNEKGKKGYEGYIKDIYARIEDFKNFEMVQLGLHSELSRYRFYIFDNAMYMGFMLKGILSTESQLYRISEKSILYQMFSQQFDDMWKKY